MMRKVVSLAFAFLREHPVRVLLTTIATLAATCMVVWIASGYDALLKSFDEYANLALGRYPLAVAPIDLDGGAAISSETVSGLKADPHVAVADPMWAIRTPIRLSKPDSNVNDVIDSTAAGPPGRRQDPLLLATESTAPPFELVSGRWLDQKAAKEPQVVVRADSAEKFRLRVNDVVVAGASSSEVRLTIVGILAAPALANPAGLTVLTPSSGEFYVTTPTAETIHNRPAEISLIGVALQDEADLTRFRFGWSPKLSRFDPPVQFQEAYEIEEALDESAAARNVRLQAYAATGVAMLAAFLVIFCTLSMGVTERVRQLAVLRAVALTKWQVAALTALESFCLATLGLAGGLLVSTVMLRSTAESSATVLHHGATLGSVSLTLSLIAVYGGAIFATILPAVRATRVRPIDAMAPAIPQSADFRPRIPVVIRGFLLLAVNPVLAFLIPFMSPPESEIEVILSLAIGFICMSVGFVLLAPLVVMGVNRWISPWVARGLKIKPRLLTGQVTSHLWRTVGAAISMSLGVGLFIGVHVWGNTMLEAFIPGSWAPDALIAFRPDGIDPVLAQQVSAFPGVDSQRCLPLVVEQPRLLNDLTQSAERASVTRQDNVIIVGMNAAKTFGGQHPLLTVEWVAGAIETAVAAMQSSRACVVPDHFLEESQLKVGDSFSVVPPENPDHPVTYTIAGAIRLPGWHWQTKPTGFRPRTHRAAAIVFADYEVVASDFSKPTASHVWFWYRKGGADETELEEAARELAQSQQSHPVTAGSNDGGLPSVQLMPVEDIRNQTRGAAGRWIWLISQVPLVALLISSFGVLNVMLASVRARRWEIGVLRALGFTRGEVVRAIIGEGLLIGCAAAILGLSFGILAGWCGCGYAQYISFFGGLHPDLVIPWPPILLGLALLLLLAGATAVWPAIDIGRTKPLTLLQRGRGAF